MLYIVLGFFVVLLILCFTSLVSFTGFYTKDEPKLRLTSNLNENPISKHRLHTAKGKSPADFQGKYKLEVNQAGVSTCGTTMPELSIPINCLPTYNIGHKNGNVIFFLT